MAKIIRSHTFDADIVEALEKVKNSSKLINDLLTEHFFGTNSNKKEEISQKLKQLTREKEETDNKMIVLVKKFDMIEKQEKEQAVKFKHIPAEILEDFNRFPDMTEEVLKSRWEGLHKEAVTWEQLKDLYAQYVDSTTTS